MKKERRHEPALCAADGLADELNRTGLDRRGIHAAAFKEPCHQGATGGVGDAINLGVGERCRSTDDEQHESRPVHSWAFRVGRRGEPPVWTDAMR